MATVSQVVVVHAKAGEVTVHQAGGSAWLACYGTNPTVSMFVGSPGGGPLETRKEVLRLIGDLEKVAAELLDQFEQQQPKPEEEGREEMMARMRARIDAAHANREADEAEKLAPLDPRD